MQKISFIAKVLFSILFVFVLTCNSYAYERIIVLYPAVTPILMKLGIAEKVVGTTRSDKAAIDAVKVGSHLRPNIELLNALQPDIILAGSKRAFPVEMKERVNAEVYYYNPPTLNNIIEEIKKLGNMFNRDAEANRLIDNLRANLKGIKALSWKPTVVYEVMADPLRVAGEKSIITSIIDTAGGRNLIEVNKKHAVVSIEEIIRINPDIYIYQIGPMNKKPVPPGERPQFRSLHANFTKVDQLSFARPGINAFDAAIKLNEIFLEMEDGKGFK